MRQMLAICLVLLCGCSKKENATETEAPAPVQLAAVTQGSIQRIVHGDGALFPVNQWNVVPKLTAPVQRFLANRGDRVRAGQLLAVLENRDLVATAAANKGQVAQAEANLQATEHVTIPESVVKARTDVESSRAAADAAKKVLDSRQKLYQEGALARKLVDDAAVVWAQAMAQLANAQEHLRTLEAAGTKAQMENAQAQVEAAQGQYRSAEAQVAYSEVRSPASGIVADRPLYPGDMAAAGAPLMVIVDISRLVARVNVPVNEASAIRTGQSASVALTSGGAGYPGNVVTVSPAADPNSATVQVWIELANPNEQLKPGATAHAAIVTGVIQNALIVPPSAILSGEQGGAAVLVVSADSIAHKREVSIGVRGADKVQIANGVQPGEQVVTVGGMGVEDNARVRVVHAEQKDDAEK